MSADYFAEFATVRFEGPESDNDLAYRWYDKDRMVLGKRMEDHLRFAGPAATSLARAPSAVLGMPGLMTRALPRPSVRRHWHS